MSRLTVVLLFAIASPQGEGCDQSEEARCARMCDPYGVEHFTGSNGGCGAVQCVCRDKPKEGPHQ